MNSFFQYATNECRVGIVGQYNAGKTVFLTSLINHLQDHEPDRFHLGSPGTTIRKFERLAPDAGWAEFNFAGCRDALVHRGTWPAKTADRSMYCCEFQRSDWRLRNCRLKLYDLPGERIADAAMLDRSYSVWSDRILDHIRNDTPYRECCKPFLDTLSKQNPSEQELIHSYKLALANLILSYKPLISPSTFLLDKSGQKARAGSASEIAEGRICGLDAGSQFVPLPGSMRGKGLAVQFDQRYLRYREDIVVHFLKGLRSCHALIVMIDVAMLLSGGVGMYDDNRQMVQDLFDVLDPGENLLETGIRQLSNLVLPVELRPSWITRVAFVAPKLDLIHPSDRDRMLHLLKRMVGKLASDRDGLTTAFFNAAAVVSARPVSGSDRMLMGVPMRDSQGKKIPPGVDCRFSPGVLPDDWPLSWEVGEYTFPEVYPQVPRRKDAPPEHINLDRILTFVLG